MRRRAPLSRGQAGEFPEETASLEDGLRLLPVLGFYTGEHYVWDRRFRRRADHVQSNVHKIRVRDWALVFR